MVAYLNLEMSAVWGPARDLVAIGAAESALGSVVEAVAKREGLKVAPEPAPDQGFFYRSDQYSFARAGVPGIWIDLGDDLVGTPAGTGLARREEYRAKRYHRPKDEFDPAWELTGTAQLATGRRARHRGDRGAGGRGSLEGRLALPALRRTAPGTAGA